MPARFAALASQHRSAPLARGLGLLLAVALAPAWGADKAFRTFDTRGLPHSDGVVVRVNHPARWKPVPVEDEMALAELRGPQGALTGILQIGRGRQRQDMEALCRPERASSMLQSLAAQEPGTRVTDVVARRIAGRPAFELRYERGTDAGFLRVRSLIVCLKDSRLLVSCGASGPARSALAAIDPVCTRVLDSLSITEE